MKKINQKQEREARKQKARATLKKPDQTSQPSLSTTDSVFQASA
jgi:hypothetical protein